MEKNVLVANVLSKNVNKFLNCTTPFLVFPRPSFSNMANARTYFSMVSISMSVRSWLCFS